ncbi:MAG: SAV_6107 family HEPN domain-containing protein [Candidatus Omnitrophota bacterium]
MALENWFQAGKLVKHTTSREELDAIFGVINRNFEDASLKGLSADQKYILSYQAAFEAGSALIHCYGYKAIKTGHHYITWQCVRDLTGDENRKAVLLFENAAKKRSKLSYDISGLASQKEADELYEEARDFVEFIKCKISEFEIK